MSENVTEAAEQRRPQKTVTPEQKRKQQNVLIVLIILIAVGAVIILYNNGVIGGSSSRKPVERYLNAIAEKNFDSFIATQPPKIADDHIADREELGLSGVEYMSRLYSDYFGEFGDDMTVELEFLDRSRIDGLYLDNFKNSYLELYGEAIRVSSSFEIDVDARFSGSLSSDTVELACYVIKSDGKWYIAGCDYRMEEEG